MFTSSAGRAAPAKQPSARRSRTVLVGFLGSVVRKLGGWMPIAAAVDLLTEAGLDESSVRTGVFRLKARGWLAPETVEGVRGYRITEEARQVLAAGDEVIWHARTPADLADGWCVVSVSVPESARAKRHKLRAHLGALGFGNIGTAVWIAPARLLPAAEQAISELGLTDHCAVFRGSYAFGQDLETMLRRSWDLAGLEKEYLEFIEAYRPVADRAGATAPGPGEAFSTYLGLINDWRTLPFRDPGLPRELLGDGWPADTAVQLFERLVVLLERPALAHAARLWPPGARI